MQIKATKIFEKNWEALNSPQRFIINEGGSRSSKTYSIIQCLILYCLKNPKKTVSVIRKTFPSLRATAYRDFIEILQEMELYNESQHSKSENIFTFPNGSRVEFFSADDEQKLRGRKRDIAWVNESNELFYEDFQQINMRTNDKCFLDYNPSDMESWIYHIPEDKSVKIHSTYKDNPFLSEAIKEEIESYKNSDPDYYTIFALGKRAFSKQNVFHQWEVSDKPSYLTEWIYAVDFGFTHPTALVRIFYHPDHKEIWCEELIYESHLTSQDILDRMKSKNVDQSRVIVTETARPEIVQDLKRAGYKTVAAIKDVREGILVVKGFKVCISPNSKNIEKENFNYRYKKVNGVLTEEPIKLFDDAIDSIRYGCFYIKKYCLRSTSNKGKVYSFEI
jgi:phage terminase large subunit